MIEALVNIANSINARTVAEGVETVDEYKKIQQLGVDFCQGYLFSKPGPPFPDVQKYV